MSLVAHGAHRAQNNYWNTKVEWMSIWIDNIGCTTSLGPIKAISYNWKHEANFGPFIPNKLALGAKNFENGQDPSTKAQNFDLMKTGSDVTYWGKKLELSKVYAEAWMMWIFENISKINKTTMGIPNFYVEIQLRRKLRATTRIENSL